MNSPVYLLEDLRRWFKEKWTAQDGSECGSYTGKGRVKCRPSKKKKLHEAKQPSKLEKQQLIKYMKGSINNPMRFYYLLLLSGMNGGKANSLLFDLKNPNLRTNSPFYRKRMMALLKSIIDSITKDQLLYNRVRSMAMSGNLKLHEQEGAATGGPMAGGESGGMGGMSVGGAFIQGMPDATPAIETPVPLWGASPPPTKKNKRRLAKMYHDFANLHRRNNAN